jgi:hypothetical protein
MQLGVGGEGVRVEGELAGLVFVRGLDGKHDWRRKERRRGDEGYK